LPRRTALSKAFLPSRPFIDTYSFGSLQIQLDERIRLWLSKKCINKSSFQPRVCCGRIDKTCIFSADIAVDPMGMESCQGRVPTIPARSEKSRDLGLLLLSIFSKQKDFGVIVSWNR